MGERKTIAKVTRRQQELHGQVTELGKQLLELGARSNAGVAMLKRDMIRIYQKMTEFDQKMFWILKI